MKNNEVLLLNDIIYKIYSIPDFNTMKLTFLNLLNLLIPNSGSSILMADHKNDKHLLCNPVCYPPKFSIAEKNYLNMEDEDYSRWIMISGKCIIIRETDLMPDEARVKTSIYKNWYEPFGLHYSLQMSIVFKDKFLGIITLYRTKEEGDFTDDEMFIMNLLQDHLNYRFYQNYTASFSPSHTYSISNLAAEYHLTNREVDVLKLLFEEMQSNEIAEKLCISTHTLKKHIQNLYRKFKVSTRWDLLKFRQ